MTQPAVCSPVAAAAARRKPYSDTGVRERAVKFAAVPGAGSEGRSACPKAPRGHGAAAGQAVPIACDVTSGEGG